MIDRMKKTLPFAAVFVLVLSAMPAVAGATEPPIKEIFSSHIGFEVNATTHGDVCTVESKNACQPATASSEPGGFYGPEGIAVTANGNIYVADQGNYRVQELTASGQFVAMFGKEVNKNGKNVCTASEAANCKAGVENAEAGGFLVPHGVAVEPAGTEENVYVQDLGAAAIDKYTPDGTFIYRIGKEVNETKVSAVASKGGTPTQAEIEEENICTAASHDICKEGVRRESESTEHAAFAFGSGRNTITVAGTEHLLYVGDGSRIQEFKPDGTWTNEIQLSSTVTSLAIDENNDTAYAIYNEEPTIHELDATTKTELGTTINIANAIVARGIVIDPAGRLAVSLYAEGAEGASVLFGDLYVANDGRLISEIGVPGRPQSFSALDFGANGALYAAAAQELLVYTPEPIGEVAASPAVCAAGPASGSSATFDCTLNGTVNPLGVAETEALFRWGKAPTELSQQTGRQNIEEPKQVQALLEGVHPHETRYYRLTAYDRSVKAPEQLASETLSFTAPSVAPMVMGALDTPAVTSSSAALFDELNPENTNTTFAFEYGACTSLESCPGKETTTPQESAAYGQIGTTAEVTGLQPLTTYRYRLAAKNEKGEPAVTEAGGSTLPEATFTTGPAPAVTATTGLPSSVTSTTALLSGSVDPDGEPATYVFELGVYAGASTVYGVVLSGPVSAQTSSVAESEQLTGLQPGTTYAYRILVRSGYGEAIGAPATFTTEGLPSVLGSPIPLPMLAIPAIAFPVEARPSATTTKGLTRAQKLAAALKTCKKDRKKDKRRSCERQARKKYGSVKKAKKK
jgi:hypothetical protein